MLYTITDTHTGTTTTCEAWDIADTLCTWFADAPEESRDEITTVIDDLQTAIQRGDHYGDHATYLGIIVD